MAVGIAVLGLNALVAAWGGIAWLRRDPSVWFWYVLRAAQAAVVIQAALGGVLLAQGRDAGGLHLFYGLTPLFISLVTEGMRVGAAQDMMLSGFDTLGIMQAGGWSTYSVLSRYVKLPPQLRCTSVAGATCPPWPAIRSVIS